MFIIVPPQKSNNAGWICLGKPLVYWICEARTLQRVIMALYIMYDSERVNTPFKLLTRI